MRRTLIAFVVLGLLVGSVAHGQTLTLSGTPALLQTVTLTVQGPPGSWLMIAASNNPGPTSFGALGSFDLGLPFTILVGPSADFAFYPVFGADGLATFSFGIPLYLPLVGMPFYFQSVYGDPFAPFGVGKSNGVSFVIADPFLAPTVSSVSPTQGPSAGGTTITLTGTNFQPGATTATLGGVPLLNVQVASPTTMTATTPGGPVGVPQALVVTTAQGGPSYLPSAFTYLPTPPALTSVTPDHAPTTGGTVVTITGSGLGTGTSVFVNGAFVLPITQTATTFVGIVQGASSPGYATLVAVSAAGFVQSSSLFRYTVPVDAGDGSDGPFEPTANVNLDTSNNGGVFNFTTVNIPAGVTVTASGPNPLRVRSQGDVVIAGSLLCDGFAGVAGIGGLAGPGGFPGGNGGTALFGPLRFGEDGQGPGAGLSDDQSTGGGGSYGTLSTNNPAQTLGIYGTADLSPLLGGSGGAGGESVVLGGVASPGGGGGGGGGAVQIAADGDVWVIGILGARGGDGTDPSTAILGSNGGPGSGGAIRIDTTGNLMVVGAVDIAGGTLVLPPGFRFGGNGRWYIRNWLGQSFSGTTATVPVATY